MKIRTSVFHPRKVNRYVPPASLIAAILVGLITSSQNALAEPTVAASDREESAGRAGEMLRRVAVNKAPTTVRTTKAVTAEQELAIARLKQEAGDDIEIHLRPGE